MKATKIFIMAALALLIAACSNDDNEFAQQPAEQLANGEITITATFDANDGATTRALSIDGDNIKSAWETTDEFAILFNDGKDNVKRTATVSSINGSSVTITFTIPQSLADNTACTIVYPASAANATNTGADVNAALATQGGTIETTPEVRVGTATIDKTNHSLSSVTKLAAQNAIFKFTTKNSAGSATVNVKSLTVSIGAHKYVVTPTSATSTLYVALPSVSGQSVRFSATGSDSKTYACSKASVTFAAGKYFQSTLKMANLSAMPLTMEALTAGNINVNFSGSVGTFTMKYSVDDGKTKNSITNTTTITVNAGDKVYFYGNGTSNTAYGDNTVVTIADGTAQTKVYGNIMSLLNETGYETATTLSYNFTFYGLFRGNTTLTDASELLLPATTLFPASSCYASMFNGCTNLTVAPALPATTLYDFCYSNMFKGCKNLISAPILPATTLQTNCYTEMFNGCTKLNNVTCLATDISAYACTDDWLKGVAAKGTFTTPSTTGWTEGVSGIPSGWTRVNYVAP